MQKIISTNRYQRGLNKNHRIELKPQKNQMLEAVILQLRRAAVIQYSH